MYDAFASFKNFFSAVETYGWWRVAIEMLLIGLVVYWVVGFLRGTRGARMLKGISFLLIALYLIVSLVGRKYGFERIEFLYGKFLYFASFAVVVVFQPELRRALMRLGETRLFRTWSSEVADEIDALVEAATFLSKRKIGALIAVQREIPLEAIAENGTRINADLRKARKLKVG